MSTSTINPIQCICLTSDIILFISRSLIWIQKKKSPMYLFHLWNIWNRVIITNLISFLEVILTSGLVLIGRFFSFIMHYIFLLFCVTGNILLNVSLCEFDLFGCWLFLHYYKYFWTLFKKMVKLLGNSLIVRGLAFEICYLFSLNSRVVFSLKLIIPL